MAQTRQNGIDKHKINEIHKRSIGRHKSDFFGIRISPRLDTEIPRKYMTHVNELYNDDINNVAVPHEKTDISIHIS